MRVLFFLVPSVLFGALALGLSVFGLAVQPVGPDGASRRGLNNVASTLAVCMAILCVLALGVGLLAMAGLIAVHHTHGAAMD